MTDTTPQAYAMVQINITATPEEFMQRYGQFVFPVFEQFGVEMIAGSWTPTTVEGSYRGNWSAILKFPSMAVAHAWYDSPEYEPYKNLRINELTDHNSVVFVEAFDPAGAAA